MLLSVGWGRKRVTVTRDGGQREGDSAQHTKWSLTLLHLCVCWSQEYQRFSSFSPLCVPTALPAVQRSILTFLRVSLPPPFLLDFFSSFNLSFLLSLLLLHFSSFFLFLFNFSFSKEHHGVLTCWFESSGSPSFNCVCASHVCSRNHIQALLPLSWHTSTCKLCPQLPKTMVLRLHRRNFCQDVVRGMTAGLHYFLICHFRLTEGIKEALTGCRRSQEGSVLPSDLWTLEPSLCSPCFHSPKVIDHLWAVCHPPPCLPHLTVTNLSNSQGDFWAPLTGGRNWCRVETKRNNYLHWPMGHEEVH